ncbi:MAG TPA: protease inhibitor I42 family protein [Polyangiaceae bacterium]|jgi:predicted secreted protein
MRSRSLAASVLAALAGLACVGCRHEAAPDHPSAGGSAATSTPAPSPPGESVGPADAAPAAPVVRVEDDGRTIDVTQGTIVTFELTRHAGTGYEWLPSPSDGGVLVQRGDRRSVRTSDVAGAPKLDVYEFSAQSAGAATVEMQLRRPWQDRPPVKSVRVTVNVH